MVMTKKVVEHVEHVREEDVAVIASPSEELLSELRCAIDNVTGLVGNLEDAIGPVLLPVTAEVATVKEATVEAAAVEESEAAHPESPVCRSIHQRLDEVLHLSAKLTRLAERVRV